MIILLFLQMFTRSGWRYAVRPDTIDGSLEHFHADPFTQDNIWLHPLLNKSVDTVLLPPQGTTCFIFFSIFW